MKKKTISYFFILLLLSQSCVVYQNTSVSLEQAVDKGKVKLISTTGSKHYFRTINEREGEYYGVNTKTDSVRIFSRDISALYLKEPMKEEANIYTTWIVYQKTSVPLEEAYDKGKVKLISATGKNHHLARIEKVDSLYFGYFYYEKTFGGRGILKEQIHYAEVEHIYIKDKYSTTLKTVGIILIPFAIVAVIVGLGAASL